jgi:outer membrane protein
MKAVRGAASVLVLAAAISVCGAAYADTFTLRDALGVAYETNPQLDADRASLRATDENVAQANAGWRPTLNAGGTYGYQEFGAAAPPSEPAGGIASTSEHPITGQVTVSEPIFRGGRTYAEVGRAKAQVRAGENELSNTEENVLLNAVTAYMDVVRDEATLRLRQNNVTVLQKQLDATQEQFKVGELTRTDVAQAQARLSGAQSDVITAEGQLNVSRSNFEHYIGRPPETLEEHPALPPVPASEEGVITLAMKQNPALRQAQENVKAANYAIDDAAGALAPQVSIQGQYEYLQGSPLEGIPGAGHISSLTANVTVPIYQGGADESLVRQQKELREQAQLAVADIGRQVIDAARSSWQSFTAAKATIVSNQTQVQADEVAYDGVKQEQQVGSRTILDVLNAEQELLNSEVAVVISQHDTCVAAYQVLSATGQLTARGLALNVRLYDPKAYYNDNASRWFGFGD